MAAAPQRVPSTEPESRATESKQPFLSRAKPTIKHWSETFRKWLIAEFLVALVVAMLVGRVHNWVFGPASYKVCVIGNLSDPRVAKFKEAFAGPLSRIGYVPVEIEEHNDGGDVANAKQIATEIATRNDVLVVVGHFVSTVSKEVLPIYLQANPAIPVILPTETNPKLIAKVSSGTYPPVFRLSPTDDDQAKRAAAFVIDQGAKAIWVVEDTSNPIYSDFLAKEFINEVQRRNPQNRQSPRRPATKILLWSNNLVIPPAYAISGLGIDWVFFAGEWQNGLILAHQLKVMKETKNAKVILSDGNVDENLLKLGGDDVEGIYLTHALAANDYTNNSFGYGRVGKDAFGLVNQLITEGDNHFTQLAAERGGIGYLIRGFLGLHRVGDARNVLVSVMLDEVLRGKKIDDKGPFRSDGTREDGNFHIWQVRGNKFTEVLQSVHQ